MKICLAQSAGFCFGVSKAVARVNELLAEGKTVYTLGPIIHNPQLVEQLAQRGVRIAKTPDEVPAGAVLVIRSHGVPWETMEHIRELPVEMCDATCPFVAKIHRIAARQSEKGALLLIAGDPNHPEVIGIRGHCYGPSFVFSSADGLMQEIEKGEWAVDHPIVMVAQTTFHTKTWEKCVEIAKKHYTNLLVFDTICDATAKRQNEAVALSQKSDIMVIVGGRQSSNTAKLRDVCSVNCPTVLIETADELSDEWFKGIRTAGVTAGASTPADIIKEVLST
ncbi:MAG: 4-hydroxy-3-methylbut-2-enyl diphosphate reductase, partial [Clostridiales bacterium]|nr:4-hydroxy-3-methylbut-2-enyl diphosphate reductase [Clostridiales bacterium]